MNKNNIKSGLSRPMKWISFRILLQTFSYLVLYTLLGFAIYLAGVTFYHLFTFQGTELIYLFAQWLQLRLTLIACLYLLVGYVAIFFHFWKKPFHYVDSILLAAENVYRLDDTLVELPSELKEAELLMNRLKMNIKNNQQAAKTAEQKKNDLVVYLAHDLKTPLTSVIGYLTLLRDEAQISEELRGKYLSISLNKAERLEDLINEFFEITRFNLSDITLESGRVNLTRILEQLTFEFRPMFGEKNLDCMLAAPPDIIIRCDADKMQRVFDNLLRNAVNYSFENSKIEITVTQEADFIKIAFVNHGNTISPDKLNRIFEQFFRLDTSRATQSGGAGLGLAIAKEIVELHGGTITAASRDEIIVFEINLPIL